MVAGCSEGEGRGLLSGLRHVLGTWLRKLQSVFGGRRKDFVLHHVVIQQGAHGASADSFVSLGLAPPPHRDDVSLTTIDVSKGPGKTTTTTAAAATTAATTTTSKAAAAPAKPTDLWRADQTAMLQGKYDLDRGFVAKYRLRQLLGEGSFGFVWVAERLRDQQEVAVKFILRDKVPAANWIFDGELGLVPLEVRFMRDIVHSNIIQYLDYYADYRFCYLVTEMHGTSWTWPNPRIDAARNPGLRPPGQLLRLGQKDVVGVAGVTRRSPCDLFECIEAHSKLPEGTVYKIFSQIYAAVTYLYAKGLVHRDLKDENVVVDEAYNIKIIDFGSASLVPRLRANSSESLDRDRATSGGGAVLTSVEGGAVRTSAEGYFERFNGTLAFAAPEVIRGLRYRPSEAEVWSLGVLLYTMLCKKSPFASTEAILRAPLDLPHEDEPGVWDLVRKMLSRNPVTRIRLEDVGAHPFMLSGGWKNG